MNVYNYYYAERGGNWRYIYNFTDGYTRHYANISYRRPHTFAKEYNFYSI